MYLSECRHARELQKTQREHHHGENGTKRFTREHRLTVSMGEHTLRSHPDRILERLNGAFNTRDEVPYATWSGVAVKLVLLGQDPPQFPRMHL
jgi:hypothetical protein